MTDACVSGIVDLRQVPIGDPDAQALIEQVQEEYVVRYGGRDESPIDHTEFVFGGMLAVVGGAVLTSVRTERRRRDDAPPRGRGGLPLA